MRAKPPKPKKMRWTRCGAALEQRMARLTDIAISGGVCGTVFVQFMPPDEHHEVPRLVNLNPALVFPTWNADDVDEVESYEIRWRSAGGVLARAIYSLNEAGAWEYWSERQERGRWEVANERAKWPWDWSPILHAKNLPNPNEFYGLSDLEDADLGDAVNFVASNTNRTLRLFAHPQMWGYGFGEGEVVADPGRIIMAKNPQAQLNMMQMQANGAAGEYLHDLTTWLYQTAQTPEMNPQVLGLGAQSGFALRVLYTDLLEKTGVKRNLYGRLIVETNRRLLDMLGKGDKAECKLFWADPLPINAAEQNATDSFEIEAGLASKETVRTRRGLDNEQEVERLEAERQEAKKIFEEQQAAQNNVGAELLKAFEKGGAPEVLSAAQKGSNGTASTNPAPGKPTGGKVPASPAQPGAGGRNGVTE